MALPGHYGQAVREIGNASRKPRMPRHQFYVRTPPWCIQPLAIVPVLPGESLMSATIQTRTVTDPLRSKLNGWWTEVHLFYVKHRDIDAYFANTTLQTMVLDPVTTHATDSVIGGGTGTYRLHGRRDYVRMCLDTVVDWWFRDEGDTVARHVNALNDLPLASYGRHDWLDSLMKNTDVTSADFSVDLNADATIKASEIETSMMMWEILKANQLTEMTYEDFLATYGVRQPAVKLNKPELIRSIREWSYPTNTVTQGTGAVSSACVWSLTETVKKTRFFREPGFLFLVSVTKPKVYRLRQPGSAVNLLDNAYLWLPAVLRDDPSTSLTVMDTVSGGVPVLANNAMLVDMRDLFMYGDQFLASCPSVANGDTIAAAGAWSVNGGTAQTYKFGVVPGATTNIRADFPEGSDTERAHLFTGSVNETMLVETEGVLSVTIAGSVVDQTPGVPLRA